MLAPKSGMGNSSVVPAIRKSSPVFNVVTWNARALLIKDPGKPWKRRAKLRVLERILRSATAVLLQEVHGTEEEAGLAFFPFAAEWHIVLNLGTDRNTGGTAVFLRKADLKNDCAIQNHNVVKGRVQRTELRADDETLILWNVHNEKLTAIQTNKAARMLRQDVIDTDRDPVRHSVWCAGDWNFLAPGESQMSIASPVSCTSAADVGSTCSRYQQLWQAVLDLMVEFQQVAPTHFSPASLTCSRIDRIFTSTPGWIVTSVRTRASLCAQPRELHETGISDHAPVSASMTFRRQLPREKQPIPRHVAESAHFKKKHDELVAEVDLRRLPPVQRWEQHKIILRQAGRYARNAMLNGAEHTEFEVNQSLATISRTVWHNDVRLARKLLQCSTLAQDHIVVTDAEVKLKCPATFRECVDNAKTAHLAKVKQKIDSDPAKASSKKKTSKSQAIARLARLWAPADKRLVLAAVKVPTSACEFFVVRRPEARSAALASAWSPTFSAKSVDEVKARTFCERWCAPAAWHLMKPASSGRIRSFIRSVVDSAPGPDGLPYSAWDSDAGAETLSGVNDFLATGYSMPINFSDQLLLFAVKGDEVDDAHEVCRTPGDTRPLSLKNSDNKIIAGVNNHLAKPMLAASAVDIQRGFVPGRIALANVLDLETYGRWYGAAGHERLRQPSADPSPRNASAPSTAPPSVPPIFVANSKKTKDAQNTPSVSAPRGGASTVGTGPPAARTVEIKKNINKSEDRARKHDYATPSNDSARCESPKARRQTCSFVGGAGTGVWRSKNPSLGAPIVSRCLPDLTHRCHSQCSDADTLPSAEDRAAACTLGSGLQGDDSRLLPLLCFWDFAAAFPSVSHFFLMLVLCLSEAPIGFINIIENMYAHNAAFIVCEGVEELAFWILCGVLQGCPLSGMLFALVMDPFLRCMKANIQDNNLAQIRACADDVGAAMQSIHVLKLFEPIFRAAAETANLHLKPKKCVAVPTSTIADESLSHNMSKWLEINIPTWKAFNIASCGKYLGFHLGPTSNAKQWVAPSAKWRLRAKSIAATHCPASAAAFLYNARAVPVMAYVAQLALLPADISTSERGVVSALMHAATNTFDDGSIFNLGVAGGPDITSLKVMSLAALARTAYRSLPAWRQSCAVLENVTDDMPVAVLTTGIASPPCWDSPPFAFNLRMAAERFTRTPPVDKFLKPSHFINKARQELAHAATRAACSLARARVPSKLYYVQKQFAKEFKTGLLPPTLVALLTTRFVKHFAAVCTVGFTPCWEELVSCLRSAPTHCAMVALKTLLNTWCTRRRYHEEGPDACIFGCADARDDMTHYASCRCLWRVSYSAARLPLCECAEEQLLLLDPNRQKLDAMVIAFTIYHEVKLGHSSIVALAHRSGDYADILSRMNSIAVAQAIKLGIGSRYVAHDRQKDGSGSANIDQPSEAPVTVAETQFSREACLFATPGEVSHNDAATPCATSPCALSSSSGDRAFCEPECSDFPAGLHHPCCSQAILNPERILTRPERAV